MKTAMPTSTHGCLSRTACSRNVAGTSVAPSRGIRAIITAHTTTHSTKTIAMSTCQFQVSAIILPAEVAMTMATENAA